MFFPLSVKLASTVADVSKTIHFKFYTILFKLPNLWRHHLRASNHLKSNELETLFTTYFWKSRQQNKKWKERLQKVRCEEKERKSLLMDKNAMKKFESSLDGFREKKKLERQKVRAGEE